MNTQTWVALAITGPILCGALLLVCRRMWKNTEARIQRMLSEGLARTTNPHYPTIDAEYRALVLNAHNDE